MFAFEIILQEVAIGAFWRIVNWFRRNNDQLYVSTKAAKFSHDLNWHDADWGRRMITDRYGWGYFAIRSVLSKPTSVSEVKAWPVVYVRRWRFVPFIRRQQVVNPLGAPQRHPYVHQIVVRRGQFPGHPPQANWDGENRPMDEVRGRACKVEPPVELSADEDLDLRVWVMGELESGEEWRGGLVLEFKTPERIVRSRLSLILRKFDESTPGIRKRG